MEGIWVRNDPGAECVCFNDKDAYLRESPVDVVPRNPRSETTLDVRMQNIHAQRNAEEEVGARESHESEVSTKVDGAVFVVAEDGFECASLTHEGVYREY